MVFEGMGLSILNEPRFEREYGRELACDREFESWKTVK